MDLESERLIAAFRGLPVPGGWGGRRKIKELDGVLDRLIEKYNIEQPSVEQTVMDNWRTIIGGQFAHRCSPQKILNGRVLLISAVNPVVRQELIFCEEAIIRQIQNLPGCKQIQEISFP